MLQLELELQPQTEKRLRTVLAQHPDQETFVQNIIAYQIAELKRAILNIRLDLQQFERTYQQSTERFYDLFNLNQLDDSEDYMIWAGIYELLRNNEEQLAVLTIVNIPYAIYLFIHILVTINSSIGLSSPKGKMRAHDVTVH